MIRQRLKLALVATALTAGAGGYAIHAAVVTPVSVASPSTFRYSGIVTNDAGQTVPAQVVSVAIFDVASGGSRKCGATGPTVMSGADGRFSIPLESSCLDVIKATPNLFVEVSVAGVALPTRTQIGAVPYAAVSQEAASAENAAGALNTRIQTLETAVSSLHPSAGAVRIDFAQNTFKATSLPDCNTTLATTPGAVPPVIASIAATQVQVQVQFRAPGCCPS